MGVSTLWRRLATVALGLHLVCERERERERERGRGRGRGEEGNQLSVEQRKGVVRVGHRGCNVFYRFAKVHPVALLVCSQASVGSSIDQSAGVDSTPTE